MKAIILLFLLLQLSLITPNPNAKIESNPKQSEILTKKNLRNTRRLAGIFDFLKKLQIFKPLKTHFSQSFQPLKEVGQSIYAEVKKDTAIINSRVKNLSSQIKKKAQLNTQELFKNIKDKILNISK